jgi:beta-glucosidase
MSDWWACAPPTVWNPANQCQTVPAALAGLDQEQPNASFFGPALRTAVALRQVPQATLDRMVHRILRTLFAVGLIDDPPVRGSLDADAGARVAEDVATRTAVLLKNDHDLLPLDRGDVRTLAVIGAPADAAPPQGTTGSAVVKPLAADTPLEGLRDVAPGVRLVYVDGRDPAAAAAAARDADGAVVYARDREHEGADRPDLSLDGHADALIATVAAANPHTAVVLMTGSAVTMPWLADVPAVLEAWYPGERGGHAIAHLLFGDANPSGRLPLTFPAALGDLPTAGSPDQWPGDAQHVVYREGLRLGYRHYDAAGIAPLFAFGHGLSYGGRSRYGDLEARADAVSFTLTNDGDRTATEVPQVYVGLPAATGEPPQRLAGWARVTLGPGESRRVTVTLDDRARDVWDTTAGRWRTVTGSVTVTVGASSRDPRLHGVLPG